MHEILKMENIKIFKRGAAQSTQILIQWLSFQTSDPRVPEITFVRLRKFFTIAIRNKHRFLFIYLFGKNIHLDLLRRWIKGA